VHRGADPKFQPLTFSGLLFLVLGALVLLNGCANPGVVAASRPFEFKADTFTFTNGLVWAYRYDEKGRWTIYHRKPKPEYYQHCFVAARSTLQFFNNARFDPAKPAVDENTYRALIHRVISINPRRTLSDDKKIVIPGYRDLRSFSEAHEQLLKSQCGGAWQSYVQRGHWRMIFPFSRRHQERTAQQILADIATQRPVVVHLVRFPQLTINHAVVFFAAKEQGNEIEFLVYDPNRPSAPTTILYDRATRTFEFAPNDYFPGGRVDVYEIYHRWNY